MTLHLIELPLSLRHLHQWAARRLPRAADEGAMLHHLLGEVFGPACLQPFRLMVAPRAREGTLYAYAAADATELAGNAAMTLTPDLAEVVDLARLRSLPRPAVWLPGQRLGFDLRLRPVVRLASALDGETEAGVQVHLKKGAEVDVFLSAALRGQPADREAIYLDWLSERLAGAATLDRAVSRLASFERSRIERHGRRIEGPDAVIHGTLIVADPEAFGTVLASGTGRHRSYGYGMMLLRPPQKANPC